MDEEGKERIEPLLAVITMTRLDPVGAKKTRECFVSPGYVRAVDLGVLLPTEQPPSRACTITALAPLRAAAFKEWTSALLASAPLGATLRELGELLVKRNHLMTLAQFESIIVEAADGARNGVHLDGIANFCFVENHKRRVSLMSAVRATERWFIDMHRFEYDFAWPPNRRLFVPNLSTIKLRI